MTFTPPSVTTLGSLLAKKLPPASPIIAPWLNAGESCLLWAGTGVGKSMMAQTLALAVAGGGKVLGWNCPQPRRVLYVDGEQAERAIKGRFELLRSTIVGTDASKAEANLEIMSRATQENPVGFIDIADEGQRTGIIDYIKKREFALVIFDNLSTLTDKIGDENSAAAMKPMQVLLTHLKKLNASAILVHHAGKNPNTYRGSSALATTFERILGVVRRPTAPATRIDAMVKLEKFRDEVPEGFRSSFPLSFETSLDGNGTKIAHWHVGDLGILEEAWAMFSAGTHSTKQSLLTEINVRYGTNHRPGNFSRDFVIKWVTELQKTTSDIESAERRMASLKKLSLPTAA